jgi:hypothetical protein
VEEQERRAAKEEEELERIAGGRDAEGGSGKESGRAEEREMREMREGIARMRGTGLRGEEMDDDDVELSDSEVGSATSSHADTPGGSLHGISVRGNAA